MRANRVTKETLKSDAGPGIIEPSGASHGRQTTGVSILAALFLGALLLPQIYFEPPAAQAPGAAERSH